MGKGLGALGDILISTGTSASLAEGPNPGEGNFPRGRVWNHLRENLGPILMATEAVLGVQRGHSRPAVWRVVLGHLSVGWTALEAVLPHSPCRGPSPSSLPCRARHSWDQREARGPPGVSPMALALSYPLPTNGPECAGGSGAGGGTKGEEMRTQETGDSSLAG